VRAILTYHSIDDTGSPISVAPAVFAQHAAWLQSGRVRVLDVAELMATAPDVDAVALTFDDGFCNFATEAAPRLEGLPVTLFVVTRHVGGTNAWRGRPAPGIPTLPLLDWDALARLAAGSVKLGAHTRTHPDLAALAFARAAEEMEGSADDLKARTGTNAEAFAYPYGSRSAAVAVAAGRKFRWACTTEMRGLGSHEAVAELPRLDMYYFRAPGRLESWGTPRFRAYLAARRLLRRGRDLTIGARWRAGVTMAEGQA
jgi:peptidoglycan/xylan/chitin deacetylase (PgdA/CDA1 family)